MIPTLAIIPARGGSKGIPGKNVRPFLGRPLLVHSIDHARHAKGVTRTVVSTDDPAIARLAREAGAEVVDRPADLATDQASSESALEHAIGVMQARGERFERVVFLQATSPLRRDDEVDLALATFDRERADSLVSVCASHDFLWSLAAGGSSGGRVGVPTNYDPLRRPRRQDMAPQFRENGSLYVFGVEGFLRHRCRLFGRIALHEMPASLGLQIDSIEDWTMLEAIGSSRRSGLGGPALANVRLVVFDFDGVMTDNRVLVLQDGTEGASCDRSDGLGVGMLRAAGMPMLVLSKEQNPVVGARCRKLGLECHQGIDDKLTRLRELVASRGLTMADVAYVGNDVNDLACMREVGLPVAVADAYPPVLAAARMVTARPGGKGAVREVCDALIEAMRSGAKG
jgi:N-acylneuraminate cytidylyltransferase